MSSPFSFSCWVLTLMLLPTFWFYVPSPFSTCALSATETTKQCCKSWTFSDLRSSSLFFLFCFFGFWHKFPAKKFRQENMCNTMLLPKTTLSLDVDLFLDQAWISSSHCCFVLSWKKQTNQPINQTKILVEGSPPETLIDLDI